MSKKPNARRRPVAPAIRALMAEVPRDGTLHPDAKLIRRLDRLLYLEKVVAVGRRRGDTAFRRKMAEVGAEFTKLGDDMVQTPANTMLGLHAKASYAIKDLDPDAPCGGIPTPFHVAQAVLFDILRMGLLNETRTEDAPA